MDDARPLFRLGSEGAWLQMQRIDEDQWQAAADWCGLLTADFTAYLTTEEVVDFAEQVLSRLSEPEGRYFAVAVTPGRNNPLRLQAHPVEGRYAFVARFTPNGDDDSCQLRMEIDPIDVEELCQIFRDFLEALG